MFSVRFAAASASAAAAAKTFASHVKTVWASHQIFGTKKVWVWENVLDDLLVTLTQGHDCDIDKHKFVCLQDKVKTTHLITPKLGSNIPRVMLITWSDFEGFRLETLFCQIFVGNFGCVFSRSNIKIGQISGMVGPIDVKRKGGASVEYWVNYVNLTFDLTHDLDLVVSRSKFEIALFEKWGIDWHGTKGMWVDHSWPWPWAMGCESIIHFMTMTVSYGSLWWGRWM